MLELGIGADVVRGIGWIFWGLIAVGLWLAISKPKTKAGKAICTVLVLAVPALIFGPSIYRGYEYRKRYAVAKALFDERCKTAGEKIYRTVNDVDGVLLLNVRDADQSADHSDPNWSGAALPNESVGTGYLASFLGWEKPYEQFVPTTGERRQDNLRRGYVSFSPSDRPGYRYVETRREDGRITRHILPPEGNPFIKLAEQSVKASAARYAVSFVNTSDAAERAQWIAGTTVTVTDTQTDEVLATSTWYAFEAGFGSKAGARQPWLFARVCPESGHSRTSTRFFVDQVLRPKQGD